MGENNFGESKYCDSYKCKNGKNGLNGKREDTGPHGDPGERGDTGPQGDPGGYVKRLLVFQNVLK